MHEWQSLLELHPDREFCQYLLDGFKYGFRIGYNYENHSYGAAKRNMASSVENPRVVEEYLAKERELGRVIGPLTPGSLQLQINRFGVIPKSSQPGKWRLIVKELLPIVLSCAIWGGYWRGKTVKCLCDNVAVVAIINSGRSKDDRAMHLMRCLTFFLAHHSTNIFAEHLPGKDNVAADALSRDNLPLFHQQVQWAAQLPTQLPQELILALVTHQPDWTSPKWRSWFNTTLEKV